MYKQSLYTSVTVIDSHIEKGALKMQDVKMPDMKMQDQVTEHEIAELHFKHHGLSKEETTDNCRVPFEC